jgi:predicted permease
MTTLWNDVKYGLRMLTQSPGFTATAVLSLALGIGANIAVFSVVNTTLLRPLPFRDSDRLVWLTTHDGRGGLSDRTYTVAAFEEFRSHNTTLQDVTCYQTFFNSIQYKLTGHGEPLPVVGIQVAENFFQTLGVQPALGRLFSPEECRKGGSPAALLSQPFWRRQFAANPAVIGQAMILNGQPVTVVGVLPSTLDFGSVFSPGMKVDVYVPAVMDFWRTWGNTLALVGRLKSGVSVAQAQAESNSLFPQLKAANPEWWEDYRSRIIPLQDYVSGTLRHSLFALWCAVGLILLIICVNLSNLLLARTSARGKEFATRAALGAGQARLIRQLLAENLVLSGAGALMGLLFAHAVVFYLAHQQSIALPLLNRIKVDGTALTWTLLIAISVGVLLGLVPGLRLSGGNLQESLKSTRAGMSQGRKHERLNATLVVSEIAMACVLLVGAGLLLRSFLRVLDVDLGFQPSHVAAIKMDCDDGGNPARRGMLLWDVLQQVNAIPGVKAAGVTDMLPLDRNRSWGFVAKENVKSMSGKEWPSAFVYVVTPGYLEAMGMRLLKGRDFNWSDQPDSDQVIIINEAAARREWPGQDPIGRLVLGIGRGETRVIGVISDVRESSLEEASSPQAYIPMTQAGPEGAELVVRSKLPPVALASSVMKTLRLWNPGQPATEFRPIQRIVDHAVSPRRFLVVLVAAFAALGLVLASLGIYGVISYSVTRQTREIGIRMALGATQARVLFDVITKTLWLTFVGVSLGTLASFVVTRWISSLLFGTEATDPTTFAVVVLLLSTVAFVGGYIPARRAARVDPMEALRCE